ncbi:MAG: glucokinase [Rhodobacteraceae bacterium]|nr:glucokinase [Paracoccaceae bacterium]
MTYPDNATSIVADIGGTNTRVALAEGPGILRETVRRFANAEHADLIAVIRRFMQETGVSDCAGACVAAAGPVRDGVARMTNLDWTIDGDAVARATGAERVAVLNDLQAQGHGLDHLGPGALRTVFRGLEEPRPGLSRLVVGIGTGFNAAPVHEGPGGRIVAASECGHAGLPVREDADLRLARFVERAHGFAGVEDALSGRGLERIFAWVAEERGSTANLSAAETMAAIAEGTNPIATEAGRTFVRLLGQVLGNLALIHLPFGGLYLIGGVARAFEPHFQTFGLLEAFRDKGRFSDFMDSFSLHVVEDDYAALAGCAAYLASRNV